MYTVNKLGGCTVTIFAPYDCDNHCEFCVNKKDYKKYKPDFDKVLESIETMHSITPCCDFVITGGEPFADMDKLCEILDLIKHLDTIMEHSVYINTTLPTTVGNQVLIDFSKKYRALINCINVSRNTYVSRRDYYSYNIPYDAQSTEDVLNKINIPVRINYTIEDERDIGQIGYIVKDYVNYPNVKEIQFREDYRNVNQNNLFYCSPMFLKTVGKLGRVFGLTTRFQGIDLKRFNCEPIRWNYDIEYIIKKTVRVQKV